MTDLSPSTDDAQNVRRSWRITAYTALLTTNRYPPFRMSSFEGSPWNFRLRDAGHLPVND